MKIINTDVFQNKNGFVRQDILIDGEYLVDEAGYGNAERSEECVLDYEGLKAIPMIADFELSKGIGAICPATMTYGEEKLTGIVRAAAQHRNIRSADLVGINMEGPFISRKMKGAQNAAYIHKPDAEMFLRLQNEANGLIKLCDIAPEEDGALECIEKLSRHTVVSLAHTSCDYETAGRAFRAGASHITHLYNAMPGIHHRMPGPVTAAWESGAQAELITDGIHIHPAIVRMTFQLFGDDRVILISDSMEATGLPDGEYSLGGQDVTVTGNRAVLTKAPGTIAGSATNLMDCMRIAVLSMHIPLASAIKAAAYNPARCIGVSDRYGSLNAGCYANILFVDDELNIRHMIHKGKSLY